MEKKPNLIDRDVLIAKIRDDGILGSGYSDSEREDDVIDMIESCKTFDAAPVVHGEWIEEYEDDEDGAMTIHRKWVRCSNCKSVYSPNVKMNFCPNCGADMRGSKDDGNRIT